VAFSPDGQRLASAAQDDTRVQLWDVASGKELLTFKHLGSVISVAFSPDSQRLASVSSDARVKLWDLASGKELLAVKVQAGSFMSMAFSPDGQRLASAGHQTVRLWEVASGKELLVLKGSGDSVAFSPDGQRLASAGYDRTVRVWEVASGKELRTLQGHTGPVSSVAFSPDGQRLASAGLGHDTQKNQIYGEVKLWEVASGKELLTLKGEGHTHGVISVAFSPDGQRLASASWDGTVQLWEAASGKELLAVKGHIGPVWSVAFSPDSRRLASAGADGAVRLWETISGKELLALKGHSGGVRSVAFSPDGQRLAAGGIDNTVRLREAVRLSLETLRQRELGERATDLVESLFSLHVRQADVLEALRDNPKLTDSLRQAALTLAKQYRPDPQALNDASWAVVRQPGASADAYRRALRQAEEACRLEPQSAAYVNTLGVAQYRTGHYQAAVETLARSAKLNATPSDGPDPSDLAFLAMAQHQLGRKEQAQATLARLRETLSKPRWTNKAALLGLGASTVGLMDSPLGPGPLLAASALLPGRTNSPENAAFLREAEALIEATPPIKK
jgi:Tol biopolymer transport system component/tetratricopeptide (TPR) repeat protein